MPETEKRSEHEKAMASKSQDRADFWHEQIDQYRKRMDTWHKAADRVEKIYRGESEEGMEIFNILWANTEVLKPVVYSRPPKPEIERRHLQSDPVGSVAAELLEKATATALEAGDFDFDREMEKVVEDMLVVGRGQCRILYDAQMIEEEYEGETFEEIVGENVGIRYVYWRDFAHSEGRSWPQVWWVGFASNMSREDLKEQFGDHIGGKVPLCGELDYKDYQEKKYGEKEEDFARVWEIWDRRTKKRFFISEGYEDIIDEEDDPLRLKKFFPCPEPLFSINSNRNLKPVPEYRMYQDQAEELNILTRRINKLTDALKVRGVYDASITSIPEMFKGEENALIPDEDFGKLSAAGGMEGAIAFPPLSIIADVLAKLTQRRQEVLAIVFQITGLSDIIRGFSDPRESATAQRMKGQYGTMRIQKRQKKLQRHIRDIIRLMCEVMAEHFDPETLAMMAGVDKNQLVMKGLNQAVALLRRDKTRDFTIDIETDSTILLDEQERKQETVEFLGGLGQFMGQAMGAVEAGLMPAAAAREIVLYAARRFNAGRELESVLQSIGQSDQQNKPDPQMVAAQMKQQMEIQKMQMQAEKQRQDYQVEMEKLKVKWAELQEKVQSSDADRQIKILSEYINQETAALQVRGRSNAS